MRPLQVDELARLRVAQENAMLGVCVLERYSETFDAMHHPVPVWTDGPIVQCGLNDTGGEEVGGDGRVLVRWSATLRLPVGTVLDLRDRIRIVMQYGESVAPMVYGIAAPVQEGPSGLVVRLAVTDPRVR